MEENLHNDKMEEFLKNSLEGHSEDPPDDLWGRIEGGLSVAPAPKVVTMKRWWMAAVAAVIIGAFLCQHFYFQNKLDNLNQAVNKNAVEIQEIGGKKTSDKEVAKDMPQAVVPEDKIEKPNNNREVDHKGVGEEGTHTNNEKPLVNSNNKGDTNIGGSIKSTPKSGNKTDNLEGNFNLPLNLGSSKDKENIVENNKNILSEDNSAIAQHEIKSLTVSDLEKLPMRSNMLGYKRDFTDYSTTVSQNIIELPIVKKRFSIGANVLRMVTREQLTTKPFNGPHPHQFFDDEKKTTGSTMLAGLSFSGKINDQFSLESGLNYRRTDFNSMHKVDLKFKDRKGGPPGGGPGGPNHGENHDFEYNLNTSAGVVAVEVRVDQTDPNQDIDEEENVALEIETNQRLEYLSVPLLANYHIGKGRLRFHLGGGFIGNILLSNTFEIGDIQTNNNHFKTGKKGASKGIQDDLKPVTVDFIASAGISFDIMPSLTLQLEPTLIKGLTQAHNERHIQASTLSYGVGAGLTYNF